MTQNNEKYARATSGAMYTPRRAHGSRHCLCAKLLEKYQVRRSTENMAASCNGFPWLVAFFLVH